MPLRTQIRILGVGCDKSGCPATLDVPQGLQHHAEYSDGFQQWLKRQGWSLWVGRSGRRWFCSLHGPSRGHRMRRVF